MNDTQMERLQRLGRAARASADSAADDREARDQAIEEADQAGEGLRPIARAVGMSVAHVQRVVVGATARRQGKSAREG